MIILINGPSEEVETTLAHKLMIEYNIPYTTIKNFKAFINDKENKEEELKNIVEKTIDNSINFNENRIIQIDGIDFDFIKKYNYEELLFICIVYSDNFVAKIKDEIEKGIYNEETVKKIEKEIEKNYKTKLECIKNDIKYFEIKEIYKQEILEIKEKVKENIINIRRYEEDEKEKIIELHCEVSKEAYINKLGKEKYEAIIFLNDIENQWKRIFDENEVLVAVIGKKIIGFICISNELFIDKIYVDVDYQNRGIGSMLLEKAHYKSKMLGKSSMAVLIPKQAKKFFIKNGYEILSKQVTNYNNKPIESISLVYRYK